MLTGCADGSRDSDFTEESASDITEESSSDALPIELPEWISIYHEDHLDENGNPVLECRPDGYYAYNGRRYWFDEGGTYYDTNGGYIIVPDAFGETRTEEQFSELDKIMCEYNAEDYLYLWCSEAEVGQQRYYAHKDGQYILQIRTVDEVPMYAVSETPDEDKTAVKVTLLVASKI